MAIQLNDTQQNDAQRNEIETRTLVANTQINFLRIGMLLMVNQDKALWSVVGHESFKDYIETLGIGSYSWVTRLVDMARVVATQQLSKEQVLEIGVSKMALLLPRLKSKTLEADMIELAKHCPVSDLREELGMKSGQSGSDCICNRCGNSRPCPRGKQ